MAAKKATAKKKATKKAAKRVRKNPFGSDMVIVASSLPDENPRHEGTKNYGRFEGMVKHVKKNRNATVADVIANTDYRRNDFEWDLERKVFQIKKVTPPAPPAA